jgi:ubiquinone/menaquinone biosynthesis C-methylase UbiE
LLYEFKKLLPNCSITGFDISEYGLKNAKEEIKENLFQYGAQDVYPFGNNAFDLVISITMLHNLHVFELKTAVKEIERVGENKYIVVEGYRNEDELFNLECWALTCESFFKPQEWIWLFNEFGYTGDYEFIYFE